MDVPIIFYATTQLSMSSFTSSFQTYYVLASSYLGRLVHQPPRGNSALCTHADTAFADCL